MNNLFFHSKFEKGEPRVTVAGIVTDNTLKIGLARCSRNDQFARKKGREIARTRADEQPMVTIPMSNKPDKITAINKLTNDLETVDLSFTRWFTEIAKTLSSAVLSAGLNVHGKLAVEK